jgi:hypothetical protein
VLTIAAGKMPDSMPIKPNPAGGSQCKATGKTGQQQEQSPDESGTLLSGLHPDSGQFAGGYGLQLFNVLFVGLDVLARYDVRPLACQKRRA